MINASTISPFKGAESNPYNMGWQVYEETSLDESMNDGRSLINLRSRSQQLLRDNPVVSGLQQAYINAICSFGPTLYGVSTNKIQQKQVEQFLTKALKHLDITGTMTLKQMLEQIVGCSFADGDILINLPLDSKRNGVQTVVELIEAHRIRTPLEFMQLDETDPGYLHVRHGVQYDTAGRVEGYWVKQAAYVGSFLSDRKEFFDFYPMYREHQGQKRLVTWLFKAPVGNRPLASRQYPLITSCIPLLKHLDDFSEAVIVGARVAACFSAFVLTKNPTGAVKSMTETDGTVNKIPDQTKRYSKMQPGTIMYLNLNEEVNFAAPNRPGDNTDSFLLRNYKIIAMSLRIPYIISFLDTEQVSYSSWRGAVIEMHKMAQRWRKDLDNVIDWIVNTLILEAQIRGEIRGTVDTVSLRKRWPALGVLDIEKEARGNVLRLENKTISPQMICDEEGEDYEAVQDDLLENELASVERQAKILKRKQELEKSLGIEFPVDKPADKQDKVKTPESGDGAKEERRKQDGNW